MASWAVLCVAFAATACLVPVHARPGSEDVWTPARLAWVGEHAKEFPATETGFQAWVKAMGRTYNTPDEEANRLKVWLAKAQFVHQHNLAFVAQNSTFTTILNKFSDMTREEFAKAYLGTRAAVTGGAHASRSGALPFPHAHVRVAAGTDVDWKERGAVSRECARTCAPLRECAQVFGCGVVGSWGRGAGEGPRLCDRGGWEDGCRGITRRRSGKSSAPGLPRPGWKTHAAVLADTSLPDNSILGDTGEGPRAMWFLLGFLGGGLCRVGSSHCRQLFLA